MFFGDSKPMFPIVQLIGPEDLSEGASSSAWVSMANCNHGIVVISVGDHAGAASAITFDQATDAVADPARDLVQRPWFSAHTFQHDVDTVGQVRRCVD